MQLSCGQIVWRLLQHKIVARESDVRAVRSPKRKRVPWAVSMRRPSEARLLPALWQAVEKVAASLWPSAQVGTFSAPVAPARRRFRLSPGARGAGGQISAGFPQARKSRAFPFLPDLCVARGAARTFCLNRCIEVAFPEACQGKTAFFFAQGSVRRCRHASTH